jgi:peptidoglycan/xylan/chitin deacetylase (PgdA/CDA1 family)
MSARHPSLNPAAIRRVFPAQAFPKRLACLTLDLEGDYAGLADRFDSLARPERIGRLLEVLRGHRVPLTAFVVTRLLGSHPRVIELLQNALQPEWASHSHDHRLDVRSYRDEIRRSRDAFARFFRFPPQGFRAPAGRLFPGDVEALRAEGFAYDSSVFPAIWSLGCGFRNRRLPTMPWEYDGGLLELPFAVVPKARVILSISYLKLLGLRAFRLLFQAFPPEPVLVIDSHLHDFVPTSARKTLPLSLRLAFKRNEAAGLAVLEWLIETLHARGYAFVTMSELAASVRETR